MDLFVSALKSFHCTGTAEWNGCVISDTIPHRILRNGDTNESNLSGNDLIDHTFSTIIGCKLQDPKTYVFSKDYKVRSSVSDGLGNPLYYEDVSESVHEDAIHCSDVLEQSNLLQLSTAQHFLSYLNQCIICEPKKCIDLLPIILFCDGHINRKKIYAFYVQPFEMESSILSQTKSNSNTSSIVIKTVSCTGPLSCKLWKKSTDKDSKDNESSRNVYSVGDLASRLTFQPHMLNANGSLPPASSISIDSFSQYQLFGESSLMMKTIDIESQMANITVDVTCDEVSNVLEVDTQHITSVNVNVCPVPGDVRCPAYCMYQDVLILEGLLRAFGPEKEVKWAECDEDDDTNDEDDIGNMQKKDIVTRISDVIAYFNAPCSSTTKEKKYETGSDDDKDILNLIVPREELDFTERMWDTLKLVGSCKELLDGLKIVMIEIEQGRATRFWLHENNQSLLAELIKKSYQGNVSTPQLHGLLSIQILVEIGLEKMKRDYVNFFFSHRLSTSTRLDQFTAIKQDSTDAEKLMSKFGGIQKLHHIVELATHCHSFLKLPMRKLDKVVRSALQAYSIENVNFGKVFSFPASYNEIKVYLENSEPTLWRMSASGRNENGKGTSHACWSRNFPFSNLISSPSDDETLDISNIESDDNVLRYYVTTVTESVATASSN